MAPLIWHTETREVASLTKWLRNPRSITQENFKALKESIPLRGFHDVLKIDLDGTVISGNQRKKALEELGINRITVMVPNRKLTDEERDAIALESNIQRGTWNFDKLKSFDLNILTDVGFDKTTLLDIWSKDLEVAEDEFDVEKEVKKIKNPITRPGDIILLGAHRLICGDSGDPLVLKRLFGEEKASMIYSDPPYNIRLDYNSGVGGKKNYGGSVNDDRTDLEYKAFLKRTLEAALLVTQGDAHVFYWSDQTYIGLVQELYRELGIENKRVCLWIKNGQNPTPGVAFNKCYEPCTYGVRGKPFLSEIQNLNEVLNKETSTGNALIEEVSDIWTAKRLSGKDYEHATSKPPKLHEKAIKRCTRPGDIILDSFSGSASTMIAAEQLKRRVYAVELEPVFCDLAIKRYESITGKKTQVIRNEESNS